MRAFENDLRQAGAAARVLLCKAAAARWKVDWRACGTAGGFVVHGADKLRFGELAAEAVGGIAAQSAATCAGRREPALWPVAAPARRAVKGRWLGQFCRRCPPARHGLCRDPPGAGRRFRLIAVDRGAADRVRGLLSVVINDRWAAAIGNNWWAANQGLTALNPTFETKGAIISSSSIDAALTAALDGAGRTHGRARAIWRRHSRARGLVTAEYRAGLGVHAAIETMTATADSRDGRLEMWLPTQAPGLARSAAAAAIGISESRVTIHPMLIGGSFGANLEHQVAEQAAILAQPLKRPVQLVWSRSEDLLHDRYRPPAAARMSARLGPNGQILGWLAKIAAPRTGHELAGRLMAGDKTVGAALALSRDRRSLRSRGRQALLPHADIAIDHHPADIGVPTGHWRSGAHSYTAFFTECFLDELAHVAGTEPLSFRIGMLGGDARLARCLSTAASLGGWEGGVPGQRARASPATAFAAATSRCWPRRISATIRAPVVDAVVAAVDFGRDDQPRSRAPADRGRADLRHRPRRLARLDRASARICRRAHGSATLGLPTLADTPEITVELIDSDAEPGRRGELAVAAGRRRRSPMRCSRVDRLAACAACRCCRSGA